ncbi:MAG: hypothetical protein K5663_06830 [Clostridiales bacterium]|nr:hypothetical protein [Clostridiales bacterium]
MGYFENCLYALYAVRRQVERDRDEIADCVNGEMLDAYLLAPEKELEELKKLENILEILQSEVELAL